MKNTRDLYKDLKEVIYKSVEDYAESNDLDITSFYCPELLVKETTGDTNLSMSFSTVVRDKRSNTWLTKHG